MSPLPWIPRAQLIPYRDGVRGYAGGSQPYSQVACVRRALGVRLELRWGLAGVDADLDAGFLILQPLQPLRVVSRYVSVEVLRRASAGLSGCRSLAVVALGREMATERPLLHCCAA